MMSVQVEENVGVNGFLIGNLYRVNPVFRNRICCCDDHAQDEQLNDEIMEFASCAPADLFSTTSGG